MSGILKPMRTLSEDAFLRLDIISSEKTQVSNDHDIQPCLTPVPTLVTKLNGGTNEGTLATNERTLSMEQTAVGTRSRVHICTPTHSPSQTAMGKPCSPSRKHTSKVRISSPTIGPVGLGDHMHLGTAAYTQYTLLAAAPTPHPTAITPFQRAIEHAEGARQMSPANNLRAVNPLVRQPFKQIPRNLEEDMQPDQLLPVRASLSPRRAPPKVPSPREASNYVPGLGLLESTIVAIDDLQRLVSYKFHGPPLSVIGSRASSAVTGSNSVSSGGKRVGRGRRGRRRTEHLDDISVCSSSYLAGGPIANSATSLRQNQSQSHEHNHSVRQSGHICAVPSVTPSRATSASPHKQPQPPSPPRSKPKRARSPSARTESSLRSASEFAAAIPLQSAGALSSQPEAKRPLKWPLVGGGAGPRRLYGQVVHQGRLQPMRTFRMKGPPMQTCMGVVSEPTHIDLHKSRTLARRVAELQTLRWSSPAEKGTSSSLSSSEPDTYASPLEFLREFRRLQQLRNVPTNVLFGDRDVPTPGPQDSAPPVLELGDDADAQERELLSALSEPPPNSAQSGSSGGGRSAEGSAAGAERRHEPQAIGESDEALTFDTDRSLKERVSFLPPIEGTYEQTSNSIVRAMAARASAQAIAVATARSEHNSEGPPRSARPASRSSASGAVGAILNVTIALNSSRTPNHRSPTPAVNRVLFGGPSSASPSPVPGASGSSVRVSFAVPRSPSSHALALALSPAASANGVSPLAARLRSSSQNVRSHRGSSSELIDSVHSTLTASAHARSARNKPAMAEASGQPKPSNQSSAAESALKTAPSADHSSVVSEFHVPHFNSDLTQDADASLSKPPNPSKE